MPGLRDQITKTIRRLSGRLETRLPSSDTFDETEFAKDPREGRQYGSYRILRRLGFGGMGHVYLALDTRLGRHAALKFLSPRLKSDPEMLARLQQEARTASSLNHPNILTIYDIAEVDGENYIASEYIDGITLRVALERQLVDPRAAVDIATQITLALVPAHAAGIIHRDLKPSNIMIRPDGLVKVIDFGLAKYESAAYGGAVYGAGSTPGSIAGTVEYMSPEQARGDSVDARSDLWSVGVVLFEMLSGKRPFEGETDSHTVVAILDHPPPAFQPPAAVTRDVLPILDRAIAKDPAKRYQSASDLLADLQALGQGPSRVSAPRLFAAISYTRQTTSHWLFAVIVGTVTLLAAIAWWWLMGGKERLVGPAWFDPKVSELVTYDGKAEIAVISPDGQYVAYTTHDHEQDQIHLLNLKTKAESRLPGYPESTLGLTFSPDGRDLYYVVHDQHEWGRLYSVTINAPQPRLVMEDLDGPIAFSPDGRQFAFKRRFDDKRTSRESIMIAQTNDVGDQRSIVTKFNSRLGGRLAWSPAGDNIAVVVPKSDLRSVVRPTVSLFSLSGKATGEYFDDQIQKLSGPLWLSKGSLLAFVGIGKGQEDSQAQLWELSTTTGRFQAFHSPTLKLNALSMTQSGSLIAGVTYDREASLWVANAGGLKHPVERSNGHPKVSSFAWDGDNLVFSSPRSGSVNLWTARPTGEPRPLLSKPGCLQAEPAVVPGKRLLVFSSTCDSAGYAQNLWLLDLVTGKESQLTNDSNYAKWASVSADGTMVVYYAWSSNTPAIWKIPLKGGTPAQITALQARNPVLSPDGKWIVCQVRESYDGKWRAVVLALSDGAIKQNLPNVPTEENTPVRWSADGRGIDFVANKASGASLWRQPLDGSPVRQLAELEDRQIDSFAWNRDGSKLAYVASSARSNVIIFHRGR